MSRVAVVIPAAGSGQRLGGGTPKALRTLAGEPMLLHAVRAMQESGCIDIILVAAPAHEVDQVRQLLLEGAPEADIRVTAGGASRQQSVGRALELLPADVDVVLVHDAARPLVPPPVVNRVVRALDVDGGPDGVVPVIPLVDTIRQIAGDHLGPVVDRNGLCAVQTPQGFLRGALLAAHARTTSDATDDSGLVEAMGGRVDAVEGHEEAFKITRPLDLELAEAVLARRRASAERVDQPDSDRGDDGDSFERRGGISG